MAVGWFLRVVTPARTVCGQTAWYRSHCGDKHGVFWLLLRMFLPSNLKVFTTNISSGRYNALRHCLVPPSPPPSPPPPPPRTPLQPNVTYHSVVTPSLGGGGEKGEARFPALWEYSPPPPPPTPNINSQTFSKGSQNITFNPRSLNMCAESANLT